MKKILNFNKIALITFVYVLLFVNSFKYNHELEPEYVDDLDMKKRVVASPLLARAEIIQEPGEETKKSGEAFVEKPIMYTTVITPSPTSVKKPCRKKPNERKKEKTEEVKLLPGQYSIPVKVNQIGEVESLDSIYKKISQVDSERINYSIDSSFTDDEKLENLLETRKLIKEDAKKLLVNLRKNIRTVKNSNIKGLNDKLIKAALNNLD